MGAPPSEARTTSQELEDRARTTRSTLECDASKGQSEQERKPNSAKAQGCAQRQQCGTCVQALVVEERPNEWGVGTTPSDPASAVELHFGHEGEDWQAW